MTKEFTPDPVFHSDTDNKFVADEYKPLGKEVYVKTETGLDAMAGSRAFREKLGRMALGAAMGGNELAAPDNILSPRFHFLDRFFRLSQ